MIITAVTFSSRQYQLQPIYRAVFQVGLQQILVNHLRITLDHMKPRMP